MTDEQIQQKATSFWDKTKAWADKNRTISGAVAGFAAGTVVPGVGNVIGAIIGAGVGFVSAKEKKVHDEKYYVEEAPLPPPPRPEPSQPFRKV